MLQNEQRNTIIKVGGVPIKMIENFNIISRIIAKHHDKKSLFNFRHSNCCCKLFLVKAAICLSLKKSIHFREALQVSSAPSEDKN